MKPVASRMRRRRVRHVIGMYRRSFAVSLAYTPPSIDSKIRPVTPNEEDMDSLEMAMAYEEAFSGGESPEDDEGPTSDVRVPVKPRPHGGSAAIALPLPENLEE